MVILDTLMFAAFVALSAPGGATGFVIHEWIGLAFVGVIVLHVVLYGGGSRPRTGGFATGRMRERA